MTDYAVSPEKLEDLNVLIDKGGHIPSEVSDALAELQIALADFEGVNEDPDVKKSFNKAVKANQKSGKAWTNVQVWHDEVKQGGGALPPTEPPEPPPTQDDWKPIGPALYQGPPKPVNSGNWQVQMAKGNYYTYQPSGDASTCSFSAPGGFCAIAVGNAPGEVLTPPGPQPGGMDSSGIVACKRSQWITMWLLDGSDVRNALYSCNNQGGN